MPPNAIFSRVCRRRVTSSMNHLGSVRVVASDKNTVVSRTDYLPFGVRMTGNGLTESTTARSAWFGFSGKENELWNAQSSTSHWVRGERYQYFGARYYDPVACSWTVVDPLAEKYPGITPYAYCAGDPVNYVDPTGEKIYMLFYTVGNRRGDEMFFAAAETRKKNIEKDASFNDMQDIVLLRSISNLSDIEALVSGIVEKYSDVYGKTAEFSIWSHGGLDGPVGTVQTTTNELDRMQMSMKGWSSIDFNFGKKAQANFFGCKTGLGNDKFPSFAQRISGLDNFENVEVHGQAASSYPSIYSNYRTSTKGIIRGSFSYPTYLVGSGHSGVRGHFLPVSRVSIPMTANYNGIVTSKSYIQPGHRF